MCAPTTTQLSLSGQILSYRKTIYKHEYHQVVARLKGVSSLIFIPPSICLHLSLSFYFSLILSPFLYTPLSLSLSTTPLHHTLSLSLKHNMHVETTYA